MDPVIYMSLIALLGGALAYGVYWAFDKFDRR
jgi:hypothetical protein